MSELSSSSAAPDGPPRRSFLTELAAVLAGAATFVVPLLSGLALLWSPLRRGPRSRGSLIALPISPDAVPSDGTPLRQVILSDHVDAWNHYQNERIGTIWIRRNDEGQLEAFSSICPHLGCSIDYRAGERDFFCPCHNSTFSLDGSRLNQIPPRDMDSLDVQLDGGRIWVRYEALSRRYAGEGARMMRACLDWLDHRTGHRALLRELLYERIPGGARWRYVWGSTLVCTFTVQVITGMCLWTAYSPSVQNAWSSVLYIEHFMWCGSLVRGIHHYAAHAMVVLLVIHVFQVIADGAYRAPRELNYWIGWFLALIVLALALSGYLLPWDQKGYYATQVATKITGATPLVGEWVQALIQGGDNYGQLTLTRFFALHAGILPSLLVAGLVVHLYLFRRHGLHVREEHRKGPMGWFWPRQVLKDALASLAVMLVVVGFAWWRGAELSAPADPAEPYSAARPDWHFLFLFQFLKFELVEHQGLAFGAVILPGLVLSVFLLMPVLAKLPGGHTFNRLYAGLVLLGIFALTGLAIYEDRTNAEHQAAIAAAKQDAERAIQLATLPSRIPLAGPQSLLRDDPLTAGGKLYAAHCASCHHYHGHDGRGRRVWDLDPQTGQRVAAQPTAPDLGTLGERAWMRSVLLDFSELFAPVKNAHWFGEADGIDPDDSEMADWSGDRDALRSPANARDLDAIVEFLISESRLPGVTLDADLVARGRELATDGVWTEDVDMACSSCHETIGEPFDPEYEGGTGYPDLAGYLSHEWLTDFLADSGSPQHYGDKNQMPAYQDRLTSQEIDLLVRWLRRDYLPLATPPSTDAADEGATGGPGDHE